MLKRRKPCVAATAKQSDAPIVSAKSPCGKSKKKKVCALNAERTWIPAAAAAARRASIRGWRRSWTSSEIIKSSWHNRKSASFQKCIRSSQNIERGGVTMSICPKNKSSKGRRDKRRANWKMSAPTLVKCSKCGALMVPHRVCKACGSYNKKEIISQDWSETL